jgi:hypothetical protein
VQTPDGPRRIEDLRPGDRVLARDPMSGRTAPAAVRRTFSRSGAATVRVTVAADDGAEEVLEVTAEHPFWIEGHGWAEAADLRPGDDVGELERELRVVDVGPGRASATVHNFEVAGGATYFAGALGTWVHNASTSRLVCDLGEWADELTADMAGRLRGIRHNLNQWLDEVSGASAQARQAIVEEGTTGLARVEFDAGDPVEFLVTARAGRLRSANDGLPAGYLDHRVLGLTADEATRLSRQFDFLGGRFAFHAEPKTVQALHSVVAAEAFAGRRVTAVHLIVDRAPCHSCARGTSHAPRPPGAGPVGLERVFQRLPLPHQGRVDAVSGRADPQGVYQLFSYLYVP